MALTAGTKLGCYEILALLGAGGMGEVYRARDTRLDRTVAIKVLPEHLHSSAEARQRFDREARAISALNHPNICHLYDVGQQDQISFLVMEYLEGETLAHRLQKGPIPLDQVLSIADQICEGLEQAHRTGLVHRDLKPSNIMLTRSGAKLMDFGLAKTPAATAVGTGSASESLVTMSQTPLTAQGSIVGTFQYMSPEQVEGKDTDGRTDIFSFGAVLYEMVTGIRAFEGKTTASTIAAVLAAEPKPISAVGRIAPPALENLVRSCLAKDADDRLQAIHDVKLHLRWIRSDNSAAGAPATTAKQTRHWLAVAGAALLALAVGFLLAVAVRPATPAATVRSFILPPEKSSFVEYASEWSPVAVSPDGTRIVVGVISAGSREMLYVRPLKALVGQILTGTEGATFPFWSADGRSIGFFAYGQLKTTEAGGGPIQTVCPAPQARGGSWNKDGIIIFAPSPFSGIFRVSATGGTPVQLTAVDSSQHQDSHRWPQFLPDGKHFLYLSRTTDRSASQIALASVDRSEPIKLIRANGNPAYAPSGYLLYPRANQVVAQRFDADRLQVSGGSITIADQVSANANVDRSSFSLSTNGVLAYQPASGEGASELIWVDRTGKVLDKVGQPAAYFGPSVSPDGRKVAVEISDPNVQANTDLWIFDLIRHSKTRFTFSGSYQDNRLPVWSPDGSQIVFSSDRGGQNQEIYEKAAGGGDTEHVLSRSSEDQYPTSWSADGRYIVGVRQGPQVGTQFLVLPIGEHKSEMELLPGAKGLSRFSFPRLSPNGKWISYSSFESGRAELYISSFPSGTGKWQVSSNGGRDSVWRRDGKELFFTTPFDDSMMSAEISEQEGEPVIGNVRALFRIHVQVSPNPVFDVSPDGKRFLINSLLLPPAAQPITLVINWDSELQKK